MEAVPELIGTVLSSGSIEPALAVTRLQKTFDQWAVECVETDKKVCGLYFKLVDPRSKRVVLGWAVVPAKEPGANLAVVRTPIGVSLPDGVSVKFGSAEPVKITYRTCGPMNCIGETEFNEAWLRAFRENESFTLIYFGNNGKRFTQDVSLKGFGDGFNYYVEQAATGTMQ